jgi:hypothetical protein
MKTNIEEIMGDQRIFKSKFAFCIDPEINSQIPPAMPKIVFFALFLSRKTNSILSLVTKNIQNYMLYQMV